MAPVADAATPTGSRLRQPRQQRAGPYSRGQPGGASTLKQRRRGPSTGGLVQFDLESDEEMCEARSHRHDDQGDAGAGASDGDDAEDADDDADGCGDKFGTDADDSDDEEGSGVEASVVAPPAIVQASPAVPAPFDKWWKDDALRGVEFTETTTDFTRESDPDYSTADVTSETDSYVTGSGTDGERRDLASRRTDSAQARAKKGKTRAFDVADAVDAAAARARPGCGGGGESSSAGVLVIGPLDPALDLSSLPTHFLCNIAHSPSRLAKLVAFVEHSRHVGLHPRDFDRALRDAFADDPELLAPYSAQAGQRSQSSSLPPLGGLEDILRIIKVHERDERKRERSHQLNCKGTPFEPARGVAVVELYECARPGNLPILDRSNPGAPHDRGPTARHARRQLRWLESTFQVHAIIADCFSECVGEYLQALWRLTHDGAPPAGKVGWTEPMVTASRAFVRREVRLLLVVDLTNLHWHPVVHDGLAVAGVDIGLYVASGAQCRRVMADSFTDAPTRALVCGMVKDPFTAPGLGPAPPVLPPVATTSSPSSAAFPIIHLAAQVTDRKRRHSDDDERGGWPAHAAGVVAKLNGLPSPYEIGTRRSLGAAAFAELKPVDAGRTAPNIRALVHPTVLFRTTDRWIACYGLALKLATITTERRSWFDTSGLLAVVRDEYEHYRQAGTGRLGLKTAHLLKPFDELDEMLGLRHLSSASDVVLLLAERFRSRVQRKGLRVSHYPAEKVDQYPTGISTEAAAAAASTSALKPKPSAKERATLSCGIDGCTTKVSGRDKWDARRALDRHHASAHADTPEGAEAAAAAASSSAPKPKPSAKTASKRAAPAPEIGKFRHDIAGLDSLKAKELEALLQSVGAPKSGNVQAKKARIIKWFEENEQGSQLD